MRSEDFWAILTVFVPLSLVAFGGMISILPSIHHNTVEVHGWATEREFVEMFAISRVAPGPGTMIVTLIGWKIGGWLGALAATLAVYVPSAIVAFLVMRVWNRYRGRKWHSALQDGLAPVAAGLFLAGVVSIVVTAGGGVLTLAVAAASGLVLTLTNRVHPVALLVSGAGVFLIAAAVS